LKYGTFVFSNFGALQIPKIISKWNMQNNFLLTKSILSNVVSRFQFEHHLPLQMMFWVVGSLSNHSILTFQILVHLKLFIYFEHVNPISQNYFWTIFNENKVIQFGVTFDFTNSLNTQGLLENHSSQSGNPFWES
jgi:hypothetical protein